MPGVSSFVQTPEKAGHSLRPLIAFAKDILKKQNVEKKHWGSFPIFLKATAGLRELTDDSNREAILESVRTFLSDKKESPFYFQVLALAPPPSTSTL